MANAYIKIHFYCLLGGRILSSNHRELPKKLRRWPLDCLHSRLAFG